MDKEQEVNGCASGCAGCSGCGHEHMELPDDFSPIITLTNEDGKDVEFEILDVVVMDDGKEYLIVAEATDEEKEDIEVVILEVNEEDGEEVYDTVTDEEVGKKVFDKFVEQQKELDLELEDDED